MSRRIEITVPSDWALPVREILEDHFSKYDADVLLDLLFRTTRLRDPKCKYHGLTRDSIWHECLEHRFTEADARDILDGIFDRKNERREDPSYKYYEQLRCAPEDVAEVRKEIKREWDMMRVSGVSDDKARRFFDEQASEKPNMVVEFSGIGKTVFIITVPGAAVSATLDRLKKNGVGSTIGRVILTTVEYVKPGLDEPLVKAMDENGKIIKKKSNKKALVGFAHFQRARQTTEEIYNGISNGATMNINTWMNLVGSSILAGSGLATNVTVFIVGSMLISPIMGPILGMTLGYRVMDWPLFKTGFINEVKMAVTAYGVGVVFGMLLGDVGNTYKWPNSAMMPEGQAFNLIISIIVSAAAGMVLGVSMTTPGGNSLVGTAISAGLLPPLVNAGMLMSYSTFYAERLVGHAYDFYEMGVYAIFFYLTHVLTIIVVANLIFWLKDIDPRFKGDGDFNFDEIPSLARHSARLGLGQKKGDGLGLGGELDRATFFVDNIRDDLKNLALDTKDRLQGVGSVFLGLGKTMGQGVMDMGKSAGQGMADMVSGDKEGDARQRRGSDGARNPLHDERDEESGEASGSVAGGSPSKKKSFASGLSISSITGGITGGFAAAAELGKKTAMDLKKAVELDEDKRRWKETTEAVNYDDEDEENSMILRHHQLSTQRNQGEHQSSESSSTPAPSPASQTQQFQAVPLDDPFDDI